jgi:hypothetical protein
MAAATEPWSRMQVLRSLVHDMDEAFTTFDAITPLKPFLGSGFASLTAGLQKAIATRYCLEDRNANEQLDHKRADILAAASEAVHVAGWTKAEVVEILGIQALPLDVDPLAKLYGCPPWEPWPPEISARRYLAELTGSDESVFKSNR